MNPTLKAKTNCLGFTTCMPNLTFNQHTKVTYHENIQKNKIYEKFS
jgi:hypothetical protein